MARPEEERRAYATFRWPDSMSDAEIPWESSRIVLDWIKSFGQGDVALIMPVGATKLEASSYQELLVEMQKPLGEFETIDAHYQYHRALCGIVVNKVASQFESVSSEMQLGIHKISSGHYVLHGSRWCGDRLRTNAVISKVDWSFQEL